MVKKRNKRTRKKYKKRGGMEYVKDEEIEELINESYEKSKDMLESFNDNNNNSIVNDLKDLLNFYFNLHKSIKNPNRKVLEHSLKVLHLFGTKKQAIAGGRVIDQILLEAMEKDIFFKALDEKNQREVLIKINALSGGASDKQLKDCNERLLAQGIKGMIKRRQQCIETNGKAGLNPQPRPKPEPKKSIKDRASTLEKQFGETGMRKTRKALRTTVGSCRSAVDEKGVKYYYNEANETTYDPESEVCMPEDGIEKTGNKSGECIGARYKGGEEYWYHPTKQFSTHDKNHPKCLTTNNYLFTDAEIKTMDNFLYGNKSGVECSELSNTKCKKSDNCDLVTKKIKGNSNNKKNKVKKCLPKTVGGKRTKRKKSRKKRKKSRKRRR